MNTGPTHTDNTDSIDKSRLQPMLGWQVTRAELHLNRKFVEHLTPFSLRPVDFFILVLIDSNHGINQRQIGDTLGLSPPNLVGVITRLIKKRLVRRVRSRQDRRIQHLHLTPTGQERLAQCESTLAHLEQELSAHLAPCDRAVLQQALQHIAEE